jgi:hypothetical protein
MRMQPLYGSSPNALFTLTLLLWYQRPERSVVRLGQQMGVCTKKLLMFTPAAVRNVCAFGIARMEPKRKSWSSVRSRTTFFCEPAGTLGGSGSGGSGGSGGGGGGGGGPPLVAPPALVAPAAAPAADASVQLKCGFLVLPVCHVNAAHSVFAAHSAQQSPNVAVPAVVPMMPWRYATLFCATNFDGHAPAGPGADPDVAPVALDVVDVSATSTHFACGLFVEPE